MWLIDRFRRKRAEDVPVANDPTLPLASILIRSMDRPALARALRSAALQTWGNVEIVVVAACGRRHKALPDTILGRSVRLIFPAGDQHLPRPAAANACLDAARGEWLNFLDDDDELLPEHLGTLLRAPRPGRERVVYSCARADDVKGRPIARIGSGGNHVQLFFHSRSVLCATAFHRSLIEEGARFDPAFPVHEDHDFQIQCATRTPFAFVDAVTCIWNAHSGDSGCGLGPNNDNAQRIEAVTRIRAKWERVFKRWLHNADALMLAGRLYLDGRDLPAAMECLERALLLRGNDGHLLQMCGMANFRDGNLARAELLLAKGVKRLPKHAGLRENLAAVRAARAGDQ
jgi:glycosyltransferase involved in cell wall biosynthesis